MNALLLVGLGGCAGAIARYLVGSILASTVSTTLTVNVAGSLALGVLVTTTLGDPLVFALGTGFCGAFTTFSSFAVETVRLVEDGERRRAVGYGVGMAVAAIGAVFVGGGVAIAIA